MKAAVYDHPGPPDVLRYADVSDPICPSDGVLIHIEAAAIEGGDLINRASAPPGHPAFVVGYAAAGEIIAVGENKNRQVGQKVTSFNLAGSHAELRAVAASRTWPVPNGSAPSLAWLFCSWFQTSPSDLLPLPRSLTTCSGYAANTRTAQGAA